MHNIDELSLEELQTKINELTRKLGMAHRMGNAHLRHQVEMALNTYQNKHREKQQALWQDQAKSQSGSDFSDRIDVS